MSSRPVSITIVSVFWFLDAALYAVLAVLSIVNHDALAALLRAISPGGAGPAAMHLAMGRLEPAYYVAMTLITGALAWGFWKLWNWSRIVVLVLIGANLVAAGFAPFIAGRSESGASNVVPLVRVAVSVLISLLVGWYLLSAKVRAAFRSSAERQSGWHMRAAPEPLNHPGNPAMGPLMSRNINGKKTPSDWRMQT